MFSAKHEGTRAIQLGGDTRWPCTLGIPPSAARGEHETTKLTLVFTVSEQVMLAEISLLDSSTMLFERLPAGVD